MSGTRFGSIAFVTAAVLIAGSAGAQSIPPATPPVPPPAPEASADPCAIAPYFQPRKLQFDLLKPEQIAGTPHYHVRLTYDFGPLPVSIDDVGEVPSADKIGFYTPGNTLTFRCGDEIGPVLAMVDLSKKLAALQSQAHASGTVSNATALVSATAAIAVGDAPAAIRRLADLSHQSVATPQKAEAFYLLGTAKYATGDTAGANNDLFTAKRVAAREPGLDDVGARADLASYRINAKSGHLKEAAFTATSIDTARISDSAVLQQVNTIKWNSVALTSDPNGSPDPVWQQLDKLLGDDFDGAPETATPVFEPGVGVPWHLTHGVFPDRMENIFTRVYHTDLLTDPCPDQKPRQYCAVSRARQLRHYDDSGVETNYGGFLGRIRFRLVRWQQSGTEGTNADRMTIEFALSEMRLDKHVWEPTRTSLYGIESTIRNDARQAAIALRAAIEQAQK